MHWYITESGIWIHLERVGSIVPTKDGLGVSVKGHRYNGPILLDKKEAYAFLIALKGASHNVCGAWEKSQDHWRGQQS